MVLAPLETREKTGESLTKKLVRAAALRYIGSKLLHMSGDFKSTSRSADVHVSGKRRASTMDLSVMRERQRGWGQQTTIDTIAVATDPNAPRRVTGLIMERCRFGSNEDIAVRPPTQIFDLREQRNDLGLLDVVRAVHIAAQQAVYLRPGDN